jgi:hypothetical protein
MSGQRVDERPTGPRTMGVDELGTADAREVAAALAAARLLSSAIEDAAVRPGPAFSDRVMAAIADEPAPAEAGFLAPLYAVGLIRGLGASVRLAWSSLKTPGRPPLGRAAALAYVLAIAVAGTSLAGVATIGVAGALGIVGPHQPQPTPTPFPSELTAPEQSQPPASESEAPEPEASDDATGGPGATDDHGGGGIAEPSDDHGGSSAPGSTSGSGDGGGGSGDGGSGSSDGGGATSTPRATETPRPTGTPRPTETPKPTSTSGSDGGGSSGGSDGGATPTQTSDH